MRELKFRVWFENVKRGEKKGEEIVWNIKSYYNYDPIIDNGGLLEVEGGWDIYGHSDENYFIEQYTGLKDKNGKEVYEGDIVKAGGLIYEVAWLEKDGGWFCFRENDDFYIPLYHLEAEVIGNIHENPELVEGEE